MARRISISPTLLRCYFGLFVVCMAGAVVLPSFAVHLRNNLLLTGSALGLMLGFKSLLEKLLGVAGGFVSDLIGRPMVIVVGLLIEAVGFWGLSVAGTWGQVVICIIILGIGGVYGSALSAQVMDLAGVELKGDDPLETAAAWYQTTANAAFAIGPALLIVFDSEVAVFRFAAVMTAAGALVLLGLPRNHDAGKRSLAGIAELLKTPGLTRVLAFSASFWLIYSVFGGVLALETDRLLGPKGRFVFYLVNAICVILFTVVLTKLARKRFSTWGILQLGMLFLSAGLFGVIFASNWVMLVTTSVVFTIGEILVSSPMQSLTAGLSKKFRGALMGLNAAAGATGGFAGNYSSAALYEVSLNAVVSISGRVLFWLGQAAVPVLVALTVCRGGHTSIPAVAGPKAEPKEEPGAESKGAPVSTFPPPLPYPIPTWTPPASAGQWELPTRSDYRLPQMQLSYGRSSHMMLPRGWSPLRPALTGYRQPVPAPATVSEPAVAPLPTRTLQPAPAPPPAPWTGAGSAVPKQRKYQCLGGLSVRWTGQRCRLVIVPSPVGPAIRRWLLRPPKRARTCRVTFRRRGGVWHVGNITIQ